MLDLEEIEECKLIAGTKPKLFSGIPSDDLLNECSKSQCFLLIIGLACLE
jgi:hypothetical protein